MTALIMPGLVGALLLLFGVVLMWIERRERAREESEPTGHEQPAPR